MAEFSVDFWWNAATTTFHFSRYNMYVYFFSPSTNIIDFPLFALCYVRRRGGDDDDDDDDDGWYDCVCMDRYFCLIIFNINSQCLLG